jgi:hypothetical protein
MCETRTATSSAPCTGSKQALERAAQDNTVNASSAEHFAKEWLGLHCAASGPSWLIKGRAHALSEHPRQPLP